MRRDLGGSVDLLDLGACLSLSCSKAFNVLCFYFFLLWVVSFYFAVYCVTLVSFVFLTLCAFPFVSVLPFPLSLQRGLDLPIIRYCTLAPHGYPD